MIDRIDNHLSNLNRSKPSYHSFRYDIPENYTGILDSNGDVIDPGSHTIDHIIYDFQTGEYVFWRGDNIVYVCTPSDDEVNVVDNFDIYSDVQNRL